MQTTMEPLKGHIDQIDSTVHFETRQMLDTWDKQIQSLCFQVGKNSDKKIQSLCFQVGKICDKKIQRLCF